MMRTAAGTVPQRVARKYRLWPVRVRLAPDEAVACALRRAPLSEGVLTARELIAMARTARADRT